MSSNATTETPAAGNDGQLLVYSSGSDKYVHAVSGSVGGLQGRLPISGMYYGGHCTINAGGFTPGQNSEVVSRFDLGRATTFDRIALNVTTGAASNVFRLGVRADTGSCYPSGTVLLDAGTIDASTTGLKTITISLALAAGRYWLSATLQGGSAAAATHRQLDPYITSDGLSPAGGYQSTAAVAGALPGTYGGPVALGGNTPNNVAYVILRAV